MNYEHIEVSKSGAIATLMLNRPEALNALNTGIMEEIEHASRGFLHEESIRVVVFKGAGKHFSAGADLKQPPPDPARTLVMRRRDAALGARMIRAITEISQVTIASVQGAALGGGACIPTACDFRIGSDDCFCGYPEVNLGINLMWHAAGCAAPGRRLGKWPRHRPGAAHPAACRSLARPGKIPLYVLSTR